MVAYETSTAKFKARFSQLSEDVSGLTMSPDSPSVRPTQKPVLDLLWARAQSWVVKLSESPAAWQQMQQSPIPFALTNTVMYYTHRAIG